MRGIYNITATVALLFASFVAYAQSEVDEQQIYEKVAAYTAEQYDAEITKIDAKQPEQIRWQHGLRVGYGPHGIISLLMLTGDISRDIYMSDYMIFKESTLSHVRLFATPWTVAYQAPPSMGFSRQEYWSGFP